MSEYVLDYVWAFALALIITFALTPLVKRFAVAVGAIDKPDARKVHHGAIPRLGGLAIFLGYVGSVLFNDSIPHDHKSVSYTHLDVYKRQAVPASTELKPSTQTESKTQHYNTHKLA